MIDREKLHIPTSVDKEWVDRVCNHLEFRTGQRRLETILRSKFGSPDTDLISGWNIIDLGCGSPYSAEEDYGSDDDFEAWFARVCSLHGAHVIGIDTFPQDTQDKPIYKHIHLDLIPLLSPDTTGLVDLLEGKENSIDMIHSQQTIKEAAPSPTFVASLGYNVLTLGGGNNRFSEQVQIIHESLKRQAKTLLKPGGILAIDREIWELTNSRELDVLKL